MKKPKPKPAKKRRQNHEQDEQQAPQSPAPRDAVSDFNALIAAALTGAMQGRALATPEERTQVAALAVAMAIEVTAQMSNPDPTKVWELRDG